MSEVQGGKGAAFQSVSMEVMTFKKLKTDAQAKKVGVLSTLRLKHRFVNMHMWVC